MPDEITGLAVLQPTWVEGIWRLHYQSTKGSGAKFSSWIFIRDEKNNHLPDRMPNYHDGMNHIWKFRREGSSLHCHPSVNDIGNGFHNSFNWSVEFVEMIAACTPEGDVWSQDRPRWSYGGTVHYDLNLEGGRECLPEMREKGIVR